MAEALAGIGHLQVNYLDNPLGMDDRNPRMQWRNDTDMPIDWRITVGTDSTLVAAGKGDMWLSPIATGTDSIVYDGKTPAPRTIYSGAWNRATNIRQWP